MRRITLLFLAALFTGCGSGPQFHGYPVFTDKKPMLSASPSIDPANTNTNTIALVVPTPGQHYVPPSFSVSQEAPTGFQALIITNPPQMIPQMIEIPVLPDPWTGAYTVFHSPTVQGPYSVLTNIVGYDVTNCNGTGQITNLFVITSPGWTAEYFKVWVNHAFVEMDYWR